MNRNKTKEDKKEGKTSTLKGTASKGARIMGSVCSAASSGAAAMLAPFVTGCTPTNSDLFTDSPGVSSPAGAAGRLQMWRVGKEGKAVPTPRSNKSRKPKSGLLTQRNKAA